MPAKLRQITRTIKPASDVEVEAYLLELFELTRYRTSAFIVLHPKSRLKGRRIKLCLYVDKKGWCVHRGGKKKWRLAECEVTSFGDNQGNTYQFILAEPD